MSLKSVFSGWVMMALTVVVATADKPGDLPVEMGLPINRSWVPPVYPKEAIDRKLEGRVQVRFIVDETGAVTKARALRSTDKVFEGAALQSVLQWRFDPATEDGRKVGKCVDVTVPFQLADRNRRLEPGPLPARIQQSLAHPSRTPPAKTGGDDPEYPDSLLSRHLPGEVLLEFLLDGEGHQQGLKVLWATHADFVHPALKAVRNWTFRPARQGDLAIDASLKASCEFTVIETKRNDLLEINGVTLAQEPGETYDIRPGLRLIVDPAYPYDLLLADIDGEAVVDFVIRDNGSVDAVAVREASRPEFGRALAAALECWGFRPARKGYQPVAIPAAARWHFKMPRIDGEGQPTARLVERLRNNDTAGMGAKGLDAQLTPRYQVAPAYSEKLRKESPVGEAVIEFVVDREGRCRLARVVSATREEFGWAAVTAVNQWVFDPPRRRGEPADVLVSIPIRFAPPK
jgi:TonB family protein